MRLFFALWPDRETSEHIANVSSSLSASLLLGAEAHAVPAQNFHVTLAFVGEVDDSQLALVRRVGATLQALQFVLTFDAYEYWPKPEVVVAVARDIPLRLKNLWLSLHEALAEHQWALNPKSLRPHITLARSVVPAPVPAALPGVPGALPGTLPGALPFNWSAGAFSLVRSDLRGAHAVYTVVDTWPLLYG